MFSDIIAGAGLALSVLNSWWIFQNNRVHLRIVPSLSLQRPDGAFVDLLYGFSRVPTEVKRAFADNGVLSIRVLNLSSFSIDILSCGFSKKKDLFFPKKNMERPFVFSVPEHITTPSGGQVVFPVKLQSRESISFIDEDFRKTVEKVFSENFTYAYVMTSCGAIRYKKIDSILSVLKNHSSNLITT